MTEEPNRLNAAEIIRTPRGEFITAYLPDEVGSYEQSCESVEDAQRGGRISERDKRKLLFVLKHRKQLYDSGVQPARPEDLRKMAREIFSDKN